MVSSKTLRMLHDLGVTGVTLIELIESIEQDFGGSQKTLNNNALRQKRFRDRQNKGVTEGVTQPVTESVTKGVTEGVTPSSNGFNGFSDSSLTSLTSSHKEKTLKGLKEKPQKADSCPYDLLMCWWNSFAEGYRLNQIEKLTEDRKRKLKSRWEDTLDQSQEKLQEVFFAIEASPFHLGKKPGSDGRIWKANFDWLISKPSVMTKLIEQHRANQQEIKEEEVRYGSN